MVSSNGKVSIFIGNSSEKAQALFPSLCDQHLDKPPTEEGYEQAGDCWTIDLVGSLSKFYMRYKPIEAIKAQALADFNAKFTTASDQ